MTTKTWMSWKLACAGLLIGCGGASAQQAPPSSPSRAQPAEMSSAEPAAVNVPDKQPAAAESKPTILTPAEESATVAKTDEEIKAAGGTEIVGAASEIPVTAQAKLMLLDGKTEVGTITFEQKGNEVTISGQLTGLKAGPHAIFIHEKGDCGRAAKNAGAHFNPTGAKHGPPASPQRHAGDFGNLDVDKQGNATFAMTTDSLTVAPGADSVVGRAVVVHARKDDGKTQPSGNAGAALACGVITTGEVQTGK